MSKYLFNTNFNTNQGHEIKKNIWTWIEMYRNNLHYLAFVGSSTPISQTNVFPVWFPTAISWNAIEIVLKVMMWSILRSQLQLQSVLAAKAVYFFFTDLKERS